MFGTEEVCKHQELPLTFVHGRAVIHESLLSESEREGEERVRLKEGIGEGEIERKSGKILNKGEK